MLVLLGASPTQVGHLVEAFQKNYQRQEEIRLQNDVAHLTLQMVKALIFCWLGLSSLELVYIVWMLRDDVHVASFVLVLIHCLAIFLYGLGSITRVLLDDEGFRVVAAWPISSQSYLAARLWPLIKDWLAATAALWTLPTIAATILLGTPVFTGCILFLTVTFVTLGAALTISAFAGPLIATVGPRRLRVVVVALKLFALALPLGLLFVLRRLNMDAVLFAELYRWLPITWISSIINAASFDIQVQDLWMPIAGFAVLTIVPLSGFRIAAKFYTKGLGLSRFEPPRQLGRLSRIFSGSFRRPADRVIAQLTIAHFRQDWRFRIQVSLVPAITLSLIAISVVGLDVTAIFSDPLVSHGVFHPAMLQVILAILVPILSLSALIVSQESGAAWILRLSVISANKLAASIRRIFWILFGGPFLISLAIGNAIYSIPLVSVAAHIVLLALLMETVACGIQRVLSYLPFSRGGHDEAIRVKLAVVFIFVYIFAAIVSALVIHVFYRYWIGYGIGMLFLLLQRKALLLHAQRGAGTSASAPHAS
ncbi:MAG: hypothetical protein QNJ97_00085 [Myxococcota bacterium]|nr:hypothetical protein [Myxococcota bacterium]